MSKAYKVVKKIIPSGEKKGDVVYTVNPVSYGTLTSDDVAKQISEESTATAGDVKAVLDRYAFYVAENLKKGYNIELLGFGTLYLRFIKDKGVNSPDQAKASLVKKIIPAFRPSYSMVNSARVYNLTPDKITLVKYGEEDGVATASVSEGANN